MVLAPGCHLHQGDGVEQFASEFLFGAAGRTTLRFCIEEKRRDHTNCLLTTDVAKVCLTLEKLMEIMQNRVLLDLNTFIFVTDMHR